MQAQIEHISDIQNDETSVLTLLPVHGVLPLDKMLNLFWWHFCNGFIIVSAYVVLSSWFHYLSHGLVFLSGFVVLASFFLPVFLIPDRLDCCLRAALSCKKLCCHSCLSQIRRWDNIWWCALISDALPCPAGSSKQKSISRGHTDGMWP